VTLWRTNPIPAGRYWLDLIGDEKRVRFEGAVSGLNSAHPGLVHVESTVHHSADEPGATQPRDWVLFALSAPTIWDFSIGTPTIAGANVHSEADTIQRPDPEPDITTRIDNALRSSQQAVQTIAWVIAGSVLAAGVLIVVSHLGAKR
jgi:hypothetical protein